MRAAPLHTAEQLSFESTYKELKYKPLLGDVSGNEAGFESTYKELKS